MFDGVYMRKQDVELFSHTCKLHDTYPHKYTLQHTLIHSMGGALAQIAAAYFSSKSNNNNNNNNNSKGAASAAPYLFTFAAPAVGNAAFCRFVDAHVAPFGGEGHTHIYKDTYTR